LIFASTSGGSQWDRFDDIVWGQNELDDTLRNAWVLRFEPVLRKLYLAAGTGTFVSDVPVSVDETTITDAHSDLQCSIDGPILVVRDQQTRSSASMWALYSMHGTRVAGGPITSPQSERISIGTLPQGQYLLTWGDDQYFRTAHVAIVR
jgi:hypothetical protein